MKKIYLLIAGLLLTASIFAQAPEKMSYQAVIRNSSNILVINQAVGMRISILQSTASGTAVYVETQMANTNDNGLVSLKIGAGTIVSGTFATINWAAGPYFIKTETDPAGGTNYTITGTSQFLSVPYSLYAKTAANGQAAGTNAGEMQYWNGTAWVLVGIPANTAGTTLQLKNGVPTWAPSYVVPDAPIIGTATLDVDQVKITYTAPVLDGNFPISSYTAISSPAGITATLAQTGSGTITTTAIPAGITYTFTVTATNLVGVSVASSPSNPVTLWPAVTNTSTGKIWMDRNLGATQVAITSSDANAYGFLYQWGRGNDQHQLRNSSTTGTLSSADSPGNGNFILAPANPFNWRSPQNNNLWQGVNGVNNPCPTGFRLPTFTELDAERVSWISNNPAGAFASPLKLPVAGQRSLFNGIISDEGEVGSYFTSDLSGSDVSTMQFGGNNAFMSVASPATGYSVRCIKD
jgi:hypothetical protein